MSYPHSPASDAINEYYNVGEFLNSLFALPEVLHEDMLAALQRDALVRCYEEAVAEAEAEEELIIGELLENHVPDWVWNILHAYMTREPLDFEGRVVPLPVQEYLIAHYLSDIGVGN